MPYRYYSDASGISRYASPSDSPLLPCPKTIQIAIARFFDGEPAEDPIAAAAAAAPPQDTRRQETLLHNLASPRSSTSSRRTRIEPAPRVVPQPESQVSVRPPLLLAILFAPFSLVYSLFSRFFRFAGWLFPPLSRLLTPSLRGTGPSSRSAPSGRRPLPARDTAARFIREFEEQYGENTLPFLETGYAQAFDLAKKKLQFLLVVLTSPEHDDTASFARDTLLAPEVVEYLRDPAHNMLLWAGNVQDPEAYQVASSLNCTKFPFAALIVHTPNVSSTAMGIATRIVGPVSPSQFLSKIRAARATHEEPLARVRAQRAEQEATRSIREQQNEAYERSLAIDRERARKKKEDAARQAQAEKEALERQHAAELRAQKAAQWRAWRAASLAPEPPVADKSAVNIRITLPSADRVVRRFASDAHIEELYAFVECYDVLQSGTSTADAQEPSDYEHAYEFLLVQPIPRKEFHVTAGGSVGELIGRGGNLIVERTNVGDDEEEDEGEV